MAAVFLMPILLIRLKIRLPGAIFLDDDGESSLAGRALAGPLRVTPASSGGSKSHLIAALPLATGLARVPAEIGEIRAGDPVDVMVF